MAAINHITGSGEHKDLLARLNDIELEEQIQYYEVGVNGSTGRAEWQWGRLLSTAYQVRDSRVNEHPSQ